jgi:glycosyltransferase involved in cell wall biosynthesis
MPVALRMMGWSAFHYIKGKETTEDIKVGAVLDAAGRSIYSLSQAAAFTEMIAAGKVRNGDVLYFQDFWTPGIEAIYYTLDLYNIKVRVYAMVHAQSVDPHDFTYYMRSWMRGIELGYAARMTGLFVASSVHAQQLSNAGVDRRKIHVVGLPFSTEGHPSFEGTRYNRVVYTSRVDKEKQPEFMCRVAKKFLEKHPNWEWWVTTSSDTLRSYNNTEGIYQIAALAATMPRFHVRTGLTKRMYYDILAHSKIQFNCSLQDYVSWTLIEAAFYGCTPVYPNYNSFPECLKGHRLYDCFGAAMCEGSALKALTEAVKSPWYASSLPGLMNQGRLKAASIAFNGAEHPYNIWEENESYSNRNH